MAMMYYAYSDPVKNILFAGVNLYIMLMRVGGAVSQGVGALCICGFLYLWGSLERININMNGCMRGSAVGTHISR